MPEYHPGTEIEIPDNVPLSKFRNAIPNTKRYMKHNNVSISEVCEASYTGDYNLLQEMLETGTEKTLYNGDINKHVNGRTPLQMAAMAGQTECALLLLKAKADPHIRENMAFGKDPEDGRTALDFAKAAGMEDIVEVLEQAEKDYAYGWYLPFGTENNAKAYNCWEWGKKPTKGFFSSRPGAAESEGFDPMKYGTGPLPDGDDDEDFIEPGAVAGGARPRIAAEPAGPSPLPVGLLFPGQGSQYVKMLESVKDLPEVKDMLAKAGPILGFDLLELCLAGPEEKLAETRYCQPAMFVGGLAGVAKLRAENEEAVSRAQCCAGLSLGEYTALCAAGVLTFEDGLKLVKLRGEAMQEAAQACKQAMVSIVGLERKVVDKLCEEAAKKEGPSGVAKVANCLFPKGFSCGGTEKAVHTLRDLAEKKEGCLKATILKTGGGFHTSLMLPAQEKLREALDEVLPRMQPPRCTVYMNYTAEPLAAGSDPKAIVELLNKQLVNPVLWHESVNRMIKDGVTDFYECGPQKQIKAMMKRIDNKVWNKTTNVEV